MLGKMYNFEFEIYVSILIIFYLLALPFMMPSPGFIPREGKGQWPKFLESLPFGGQLFYFPFASLEDERKNVCLKFQSKLLLENYTLNFNILCLYLIRASSKWTEHIHLNSLFESSFKFPYLEWIRQAKATTATSSKIKYLYFSKPQTLQVSSFNRGWMCAKGGENDARESSSSPGIVFGSV